MSKKRSKKLEEKWEELKTGCLQSIITFALTLPLMVLKGWVLSILWLWFLVPLGLPAISLWHAVGVSTLLTVMQNITRPGSESDKGWNDFLKWSVIVPVVFPLIALLFGWVAKTLGGM